MEDIKHMRQVSPKVVTKVNFPDRPSQREMYENELGRSKTTGVLFQKFYTETKLYFTNFKIGSDCNEIIFINQGTTTLSINDVALVPQQSLVISGWTNEIDTTQYNVLFPTPNNVGNRLVVIRKLYI